MQIPVAVTLAVANPFIAAPVETNQSSRRLSRRRLPVCRSTRDAQAGLNCPTRHREPGLAILCWPSRLSENIDCCHFVLERRTLRDGHFKITGDSAGIARVRKVQRTL